MTPLTSPQHAHFDTFGYLHFPGLLADRAAAISAPAAPLTASSASLTSHFPPPISRLTCF